MRRYSDWIDSPIVRGARFVVHWLAQLLLAILLVLTWLLIALVVGLAPMVLLRAAGRAIQPQILSVDEIFSDKAEPDVRPASANTPPP